MDAPERARRVSTATAPDGRTTQRDALGKALGYRQGATGTWVGRCPTCGGKDGSVGLLSMDCPEDGCGSLSLQRAWKLYGEGSVSSSSAGVPLVRTLADILADPEALRPPEAVVPRLAWKGRTTLLAAREKLGKSTVAARGAATVSKGGRFLGERCPNLPVLWAGLEEAVSDAARRFVDFGAAPARIYLVDRLGDPFADLAQAVGVSGAGLVVVDSLAAFAERLVDDPSSSTAWTGVMAKFTRLTRDSGAALLLLHHARKSDGAYRDSSAIGAGVDALIEMREGDESSIRKFAPRGRWAVEPFAASFDGTEYQLVSGELSLDARAELFIRREPGCSMRALRSGVSGKAEAIQAAVERLLGAGAVEDRGVGGARAFYPVEPGEPLRLFDEGTADE